MIERLIGLLGMTSSRILLVDDNHIQSATRRAILEGSGREVCIALEGQRALELLNEAENSDPIGLIVTDHLMPVMSGPSLWLSFAGAVLPFPWSCSAACPMPNPHTKG